MNDQRKKYTMTDVEKEQKDVKEKRTKKDTVKSNHIRYKHADHIYK